MSIKNQLQKYRFDDFSLWFLLFSNFTTIFFAIREGWDLKTIIWIYWFQSITIGLFNFIRILQLKEFSTENFKINDRSVQPTQHTKIFTAFFFLFHYGLFHSVYFMFLLVGTFGGSLEGSTNIIDIKFIFLTVLLFFINHLFSFIYNRPKDTKKQNIGTLMFYPYARIIPMHMTILIGSMIALGGNFGAMVLPFFLILKTVADAIMHIIEHQVIRKGEEQEA